MLKKKSSPVISHLNFLNKWWETRLLPSQPLIIIFSEQHRPHVYSLHKCVRLVWACYCSTTFWTLSHACRLPSDSPYNVYIHAWLCSKSNRGVHACVYAECLACLLTALTSNTFNHNALGAKWNTRQARRETGFHSQRGEEGAVGWGFDHMQIPHTQGI